MGFFRNFNEYAHFGIDVLAAEDGEPPFQATMLARYPSENADPLVNPPAHSDDNGEIQQL